MQLFYTQKKIHEKKYLQQTAWENSMRVPSCEEENSILEFSFSASFTTATNLFGSCELTFKRESIEMIINKKHDKRHFLYGTC